MEGRKVQMKKGILIVTLILILLLVSSLFTGCIPKKASSSSSSSSDPEPTNVENRLASLERAVSQIQSNPSGNSADIDSLNSRISNLQNQIDNLQQENSKLLNDYNNLRNDFINYKDEQAENAPSATNSTGEDYTTWDPDFYIWTEKEPSNFFIDHYVRGKIDEEDFYDIKLTIYYNNDDGDTDDSITTKMILSGDFTPKSGDIVFVDDNNTFIDTVSNPHYLWSVDLTTRGDQKYTRRINAESEKFTVTLYENDPLEITLEFSLAYE